MDAVMDAVHAVNMASAYFVNARIQRAARIGWGRGGVGSWGGGGGGHNWTIEWGY